MRPLKTQYFLCFAAIGSLLPMMPVFLRDRGLDKGQVGYIMAASSIAIIVTPVIIAFLADTRFDPRRIMGWVYVLAAIPLLCMSVVHGYLALLVLYAIHSLAFVPANSLQDGMAFTAQRNQELAGERPKAFHRIRVWGTIGFILPSLILFFLLRSKIATTDAILYTAAGFCFLGLLNTRLLPPDCARVSTNADTESQPPKTGGTRLPTVAAARAFMQKDLLALCAAMFLMQLVTMTYYSFYPVYLRDKVVIPPDLIDFLGASHDHPGVPPQWIGLITNVGVAGEIFYMLALGRLERFLGLKMLLILGIIASALRMILMSLSTSLFVAVGCQLLHGMMVLGVNIAPIVYINRRAGDNFRNSMQGFFAMTILGLGRVVGNLIAGQIANSSETYGLTRAFVYGAVLAGIAIGILAIYFTEHRGHVGNETKTVS